MQKVQSEVQRKSLVDCLYTPNKIKIARKDQILRLLYAQCFFYQRKNMQFQELGHGIAELKRRLQ